MNLKVPMRIVCATSTYSVCCNLAPGKPQTLPQADGTRYRHLPKCLQCLLPGEGVVRMNSMHNIAAFACGNVAYPTNRDATPLCSFRRLPSSHFEEALFTLSFVLCFVFVASAKVRTLKHSSGKCTRANISGALRVLTRHRYTIDSDSASKVYKCMRKMLSFLHVPSQRSERR